MFNDKKPRKVIATAIDNKGQLNAHQIVSAHKDPLTKEHIIEYTVVSVNKDRLSQMLIPDGFGDLSLSENAEDRELIKDIYEDITSQTKDNPSTRALSGRSFSKAITFQYMYHPDTYEILNSSVQPTMARVGHTEYYYNVQKIMRNYSYGIKPMAMELHDFACVQKQLATGQELSSYQMPIQEVLKQVAVLVQKTASATAIELGINCLHKTQMEDLPFICTQDAMKDNSGDLFTPITTTKHSEHSLSNLAFSVYLHEGKNIFSPAEERALAIGASLSVEKKLKAVG